MRDGNLLVTAVIALAAYGAFELLRRVSGLLRGRKDAFKQGVPACAVVYAKDLERLAAFYSGVAGLQEVQSEPGSVTLQGSGLQLVLVAIPDRIAAGIRIATPPERREDTPIKLVFAVRSIAAARAAALRLGGELDAQDKEWEFQGSRVCDGHDPEGNVIQIREPAG